MPTYFYADLVRVACHATGTGALALGDAVPGHRPFAGIVPPATSFHYSIVGITDPSQWENGIGQLAPDGRLVRISVTASPAGNAAVDFGAGLKTAALTVGASWFAAADVARAQAAADLVGLTEAVAVRQPLSTLHPAAATAEAGDSVTVRRGSGWFNIPMGALLRRSATGRFVADAPLDLMAGTAGATALALGGDAGLGLFRPAANILAFSSAGTERMRIGPDGRVGIGSTDPAALVTAALPAAVFGSGNPYLSFDYGGHSVLRMFMDSQWRTRFVASSAGGSGTPGFGFDGPNGTLLEVELGGAVRPGADNAQTLGSASHRWSVVYAGTGTINTSDAREKAWRGGLSDTEMRAARRIARAIGVFQWNAAIAAKGQTGARLHIGVEAQAVWAIMADEGLVDPISADGVAGATPYAFLCWDRWDGGDRFGVRSDQLALFIAAAQESRIAALEAAA